MSVKEENIFSASSQQWRLINPNRPPGMPPLAPVRLAKNEKPKPNYTPADGAYYYQSIPISKNVDLAHNSKPNAKNHDGCKYYYDRNQDQKNSNKVTSAQSRLLKYKK